MPSRPSCGSGSPRPGTHFPDKRGADFPVRTSFVFSESTRASNWPPHRADTVIVDRDHAGHLLDRGKRNHLAGAGQRSRPGSVRSTNSSSVPVVALDQHPSGDRVEDAQIEIGRVDLALDHPRHRKRRALEKVPLSGDKQGIVEPGVACLPPGGNVGGVGNGLHPGQIPARPARVPGSDARS